MYMSYSAFNFWDRCKLSYWHRYIAKTRPPEIDNRVNMLYGAIVGVAFEQFYNEKMWRLPNFLEELYGRLPRIGAKVIADETADGKNGTIIWGEKRPGDKKPTYKSLDEVLEDVRGAVQRGLKTIRYHRLVGPEAVAELKLDSKINGHHLAGRADFVIQRVPPDNDKIILDGKGSKFRDDYVDKRQLRWYAMLYEHQRKFLPDKVGFLYWRSEPEAAIDWHQVTAAETATLRESVFETIEIIEAKRRQLPIAPEPTRQQIVEHFPAQPSKDCKWCNFLSACDEGTRHVKNQGKHPEPISEGDPDGTGVGDVGL